MLIPATIFICYWLLHIFPRVSIGITTTTTSTTTASGGSSGSSSLEGSINGFGSDNKRSGTRGAHAFSSRQPSLTTRPSHGSCVISISTGVGERVTVTGSESMAASHCWSNGGQVRLGLD